MSKMQEKLRRGSVSKLHAVSIHDALRKPCKVGGSKSSIEGRRTALAEQANFETGYAAFKSTPDVPYKVLEITDDAKLKLKGLEDTASPCNMIAVPAPKKYKKRK